MNEDQKIVFEYLKHKSEYPMTAVFTLDDLPNKYQEEVVDAYRRLSSAEEAFVLIALGNYVIQKSGIDDGS